MAGSPGAKIVGRLALKVLPDTSEFVPRLKAFAQRVEQQVKIEIPVTLDRKHMAAELRAAKAEMQAQARLNPVEIPLKPDVKQTDLAFKRIIAGMDGINAQGGQVSSLLGRWGAIILVVGSLLIGLGPSIAILIPLALGLGAAVGAVALGWEQVKKAVAPLGDEFKKLRSTIGTELVAGLQPIISSIGSKLFPVLTTGLGKFAGLLNSAFKELGKFLTSKAGLQLVGDAFTAMASALQPFIQLLTPVTKLLLGLSVAAAPGLKLIGDFLLDLTNRFANFVASGKATDAITNSVRDIIALLKQIGSAVKASFPVMNNALKAAIPLLAGVGQFFGAVLKIVGPLFALMAQHTTTMKVLGVAIGAVAFAMALLSSPILLIVFTIAVLVAAISKLPALWELMKTAGIAAWNALKAVVAGVWAAIQLGAQAFVIAFQGVWAGLKAAGTAVWNAIKSAATKTWNGIKAVVQAVIAFIVGYVRAQIAVIATAWNIIKTAVSTVWNGIKSVISTAWNGIKSVVQKGMDTVKSILDFDFTAAGEKIINTLKAGFEKAAKPFIKVAEGIASTIAGLWPGSPIKWGPLKSWNNGGTGVKLMDMLAHGIDRGQSSLKSSMFNSLRTLNNMIAADAAFNPVFAASGVSSIAGQANSLNGTADSTAGSTGPLVQLDVHPQPGQSEVEIAEMTASRLMFKLRGR